MPNLTNRKILIFAPWIPPHRNSEAHVTGRLLLAFQRAGIYFDVISSPPSGVENQEDQLQTWAPLSKSQHIVPNVQPSAASVMFHRVSCMLTSGHIVPGGMTWADYAIKEGKRLAKIGKYDLIMSRSQPAIGHLPALVLSKKLNIPWVANWNDIEPAIRSPIPYGSGLAAKISINFNNYLEDVIDSASQHTLCSERSLEYMEKIFPKLKTKASVIPHLAIVDKYDLPKYSKKGIFTICHAGTFDGRRSPTVLFKALTLFLEKVDRKNVRVNFLGNNYAGETGFDIPSHLQDVVTVHPWADYEMTGRQMSMADVLLVIEASMEESIFLPGKFSEYVNFCRPILALTPQLSTLRDIMSHKGGG